MTTTGWPVVLFDLDGTLVDSRDDIVEAFVHGATGIRPGHALDPASVARLIGTPLAEMAEALGMSLSEAEVVPFEQAYRSRYDRLAGRRTKPYPGVPELLASLAPRVIGVVTAKLSRQADMILAAAGLAAHVRHVQGWAPGLRHKPDPQLVTLALEALGARPGDAVLVGDTPRDVLAGRAAGVATIAVTWGFGDESELRAAAPDHVVATARELRLLLG